jgi:hypothetical protein
LVANTERDNKMPYWVVGAMFGGTDDQLQNFIRRGYWYCWDPRHGEVPAAVQSLFPQIRVGDRIAVKRLLGKGASDIEIRALGIVRDVDLDEWRIYVNWLVSDLARRVPMHGCAGSIHGPYEADENWTRQVFQI